MRALPPIARIVGVALNAAIDKTVTVDRLRPGDIHRPDVLAMVPGGKAANTVRAAAHLGIQGAVVAVVGGRAGAWYADRLRALGVALHAVDQPGETRTCLSVLDRSTGRLTEFYEAGLRLDADAWRGVEQALREALEPDPSGTLVVLAGSLPPGAPEDAYGRLGRLSSDLGATWSVDIPGPQLLAALEASPWLVKLNEHEVLETTDAPSGSEADVVRGARRLRSGGARNVVVTRGLEGAILVTDDGMWRYGPSPVRGLYPVGSGDALVAGLAASVARGQSLPEAVRYGSAVAAANALVPGQGDFEADVIDEIVDGIGMSRVDQLNEPVTPRPTRSPG